MKTADEWLQDEGYTSEMIYTYDNIVNMMTMFVGKHDKEIIALIDEMTNAVEESLTLQIISDSQISILTRLKNKL